MSDVLECFNFQTTGWSRLKGASETESPEIRLSFEEVFQNL
jgi:hypothetical protein